MSLTTEAPRLARAGWESPPQVFDGALGGSGQVKQAKGIPLVKNGRGNTSYVVCVCVCVWAQKRLPKRRDTACLVLQSREMKKTIE